MTREDIIAALSAIEQAVDDRVEVWRIVVVERGRFIKRIYRGSFFNRK